LRRAVGSDGNDVPVRDGDANIRVEAVVEEGVGGVEKHGVRESPHPGIGLARTCLDR
jgi:hypothetical protein